MDTSFIIFLVCIILIFVIITLMYIRGKTVVNYQDSYMSTQNNNLKHIPKKLFQLVSDKNKVDPQFQKNIKFLQNLNPDWEYHLLDDNDIIEYLNLNYDRKILDIYNKINPKYGACRADFFRYLLMYKEGGAYFDIKSACIYPLSKVILPDDEYILSYWDTPTQSFNVNNLYGELQQWHIICRPNHPYLYEVIKSVIEKINNYTVSDGVGKMGVLKLTGPIIYTNTILPILSKHNHRLVELNEFIGLVYNNLGQATQQSHKNLFSKTHYSKITDPIII